MECSKCHFENPEGSIRCEACDTLFPSLSSGHRPLLRSQPVYWEEMTPKARICLFLAVVNLLLLSYVTMISVSPANPVTRSLLIFESHWGNGLFLGLLLLLISSCLFPFIDRLYRKLHRVRLRRTKLGRVLVCEGYVTREEVDEALEEQGLRLGEALMRAGVITRHQLEDTLRSQRKAGRKLGELLKEQGLLTEEQLCNALNRADRRLGEILQEKGRLTENELEWVLCLQRHGPKKSA
jgi:hypothetical protein